MAYLKVDNLLYFILTTSEGQILDGCSTFFSPAHSAVNLL